VIDTPGILDHPLDQRNTIEMQAITALAHLNSCVLFLMDISENCGYTIDQQISLFQSIKPLFQAKPLVIVLTKSDLAKYADLKSEVRKQIEEMAKETNAFLIQMSNISGDGVNDVKAKACDILLDHRLTQKAKDPKKAEAIMGKLHIAQPKKRDNKVREGHVPETVIKGVKKTGPTIKELQEEFGGAGIFYIPEEEHYIIENEDWRYDKWPEFFMGKNVADYYDPEIVQKLNALEEEEAKILQQEKEEQEMAESSEDEDGIATSDLAKTLKKVKSKISVIKGLHDLKAKTRARSKIKTLDEMKETLKEKGIDVNEESLATRAKNRRTIASLEEAQDKKAKRELGVENDSDDDSDEVDSDEEMRDAEGEERGRRKGRSEKKVKLGKRRAEHEADEAMDDEENEDDIPMALRGSLGKQRRSMTPAQRKISAKKILRDRSASRREGNEPKRLDYKIVPEEQIRLAKKINSMWKHKIQRSEADREITVKKPKHLFSGKMSNGKRDRR
jgi:nucleolar GTP-binding protein